MRYKVSTNFNLDEFVNPMLYHTFGERSIHYVQKPVIIAAQLLRIKFGLAEINTWYDGGNKTDSGVREFDSAVGAGRSYHKYGGAIDIRFKDASPEDVRKYILGNQNVFLNVGITTIEDGTPTWTHIDSRNTNMKNIYVVPFWRK